MCRRSNNNKAFTGKILQGQLFKTIKTAYEILFDMINKILQGLNVSEIKKHLLCNKLSNIWHTHISTLKSSFYNKLVSQTVRIHKPNFSLMFHSCFYTQNAF